MKLLVSNTDEALALAWLKGDAPGNAGREALQRMLKARRCSRAVMTAFADVLDPDGDSKMYLARGVGGGFELVRRR